MKTLPRSLASSAVFVIAGCSQIAVLSEHRPGAFVATAESDQAVAIEINRALATERKQPVKALSVFVATARDALGELGRNLSDAGALRTYNFAVARIFSVVREANLDPKEMRFWI